MTKSILRDAVLHALEVRPTQEQIAIRSRRGQRQVYDGTQLGEQSEAIARQLRRWLGDTPHVLVVALPAGMEFITLLFGAILANVTVVPVPVPRQGSNSARFQHIVADCGASAVLCLPDQVGRIRSALSDSLAQTCPVVAVPLEDHALPEPIAPQHSMTLLPAIIQYTSGSTRAPKGVLITGENIVDNFQVVQRSWGFDAQSRFVNWLPHYHDMGLMGGILYPLLSGGVSVQISPLDFIRKPILWPEAVAQERANFSGGAAFGFAECIRRISQEMIEDLDLSCWSRAFCGAEPVSSGLLAAFQKHFDATGLRRDAVFACYGLAEMTLFAAGAPGIAAPSGQKTQVEPCHLTPELSRKIAIVSTEEGTELADGSEGEIWLRGASQGLGYLGLPKETAATFDQKLGPERGWLRTGDMGRKTETALYVTGRIKDIIICNGTKIAAPEVEWLASRMHPALNPMAIAAFMSDPAQSGRATLIAETGLGQAVDDTDHAELSNRIRQAVRGEWGLDLIEILFVPRGRLERTSSGKIQRGTVAQAWRDGSYQKRETLS